MVNFDVSVVERSCQVRGDFACARCGQRDEVYLTLKTQGQATASATSQDSREVAAERAKKIALKQSQQTFNVLQCPRCGEMNPGSLGRFVRAQAAVAVALSTILSSGPAMYAAAKGEDPMLWGAATFVFGVVLVMLLGFRTARNRRVTFASSATRRARAR